MRKCAIVLFTRDLRLHAQPALSAAVDAVYVSEDVSAYARERERRLGRALAGGRIELETFPGVTVVPPGELAPAGSDHFRVFTPYWRRWRVEPRRPVLLAANPELARDDLRPRDAPWRDDDEALDAWKAGHTGYPVVDAGMRQLLREGRMHNRARLVVGSFLTKHLGIDWRAGAAHFFEHLVDGDVANNTGNWQWVAGTGADSRPYRMLSPYRQAERFDPHGTYVQRYVPELGTSDYPDPIVVHEDAVARFRRAAA